MCVIHVHVHVPGVYNAIMMKEMISREMHGVYAYSLNLHVLAQCCIEEYVFL